MSVQTLRAPEGKAFIEVNGQPIHKSKLQPVQDDDYKYLAINTGGVVEFPRTHFSEIMVLTDSGTEGFADGAALQLFVEGNFFDAGSGGGAATLQEVTAAGSTTNIPLFAPAFNIYDEGADDTYGSARIDGTQGVLDLINRTPGAGSIVSLAGATSIGAGGGSSRWNHQDEGIVDTASREWVGKRAAGGSVTFIAGNTSGVINGLPSTIEFPICSPKNEEAVELMANAGYVPRAEVTAPGQITIFSVLPAAGGEVFHWNAIY